MAHLSIDDIVKNGKQWNLEWLQGEGSDHWLASTWKILHCKTLTFAETSCEVTAAMIRWKLGTGDDWELVPDRKRFEEIEKQSSRFQITIGTDWCNCHHQVTIWDGCLIQSYYNKYTIQSTPINDEIREAFNNISSEGSYETVTKSPNFPQGVSISERENYKTYYWVPSS